MACFLVPAAEAIVTTVIAKAVKSHETKINENSKIKSADDKMFYFLFRKNDFIGIKAEKLSNHALV